MVALVVTGCPKKSKRQPASINPPPTSTDYGSRGTRTEPLDSGPDVRPVGDDGLRGTDLAGSESGEGGPLADIRFEYDSSALTAAAQQTLASHAAWLRDRSLQPVVLEGHCDERGTVEYNLALGEQRARAVYDYLIGLGVPASQMQTVTFGKERPLETGHAEEAWAKNRRVHFAVDGSR
jgi:peptidoglycan-associated lipoprotein